MPSVTLHIAFIEHVEPRLRAFPLAAGSLWTKELVPVVPHVFVILTAAVKHLRVACQVQRRRVVCQGPVIV